MVVHRTPPGRRLEVESCNAYIQEAVKGAAEAELNPGPIQSYLAIWRRCGGVELLYHVLWLASEHDRERNVDKVWIEVKELSCGGGW
jgi:hypothetical protein